MKDVKAVLVGLLVMILLLLPIFGLVAGWKWYQAGIQAEVWRREGVELTTWEVFNGAKPVERVFKHGDK